MKKTYINPNMVVVKMTTQLQLLNMSSGSGQLSGKAASEWGAHDDDFDW